MTDTTTRRAQQPLRVWVLPEEKQIIAANAQAAGMPVSAFLRAAGMGAELKSVVDLEQVAELAKINADLGRLGGLLKLWLSKDSRFVAGAPTRGDVTDLLEQIRLTQDELRQAARRVVDSF